MEMSEQEKKRRENWLRVGRGGVWIVTIGFLISIQLCRVYNGAHSFDQTMLGGCVGAWAAVSMHFVGEKKIVKLLSKLKNNSNAYVAIVLSISLMQVFLSLIIHKHIAKVEQEHGNSNKSQFYMPLENDWNIANLKPCPSAEETQSRPRNADHSFLLTSVCIMSLGASLGAYISPEKYRSTNKAVKLLISYVVYTPMLMIFITSKPDLQQFGIYFWFFLKNIPSMFFSTLSVWYCLGSPDVKVVSKKKKKIKKSK